MQVQEAIEAYSFAVLSLAPKTQEWYLQKLAVFSDWCKESNIQLDNLTIHHVRKFAQYLTTRTNPHR
jgi:integrase-like protein